MNQRLLFMQLVIAEGGGKISFTELAERIYGEATPVTLNRITSLKYLASKSHPHIHIGSTPPNSQGGEGYYWWMGGDGVGSRRSSKSSGTGNTEGSVDRRSKNRKQLAKRRGIRPDQQPDDSRPMEPSKRGRKRSRVSNSGIYSDV